MSERVGAADDLTLCRQFPDADLEQEAVRRYRLASERYAWIDDVTAWRVLAQACRETGRLELARMAKAGVDQERREKWRRDEELLRGKGVAP